MDPNQFSLRCFRVICDGSACGSGNVGEHIHPAQVGTAIATVRVVDNVRIEYLPIDEVA